MPRARIELLHGDFWPANPVVVVPCYNEQHRLPKKAFSSLAETGVVNLLFVDDGSTDRTITMLEELERLHKNVKFVQLERNVGKGEAVRFGLQCAVASKADVVGYYDADMSTPATELLRMLQVLQDNPDLHGVLGCRVARLGSIISRSQFRHYVGRLYATIASTVLRLAVYDTQCGAKVFRTTPELQAAITDQFPSRWAFDVFLLNRMLHAGSGRNGLRPSFLELPLEQWQDVGHSKVGVLAGIRALLDLRLVRNDAKVMNTNHYACAEGSPRARKPARTLIGLRSSPALYDISTTSTPLGAKGITGYEDHRDQCQHRERHEADGLT